MSITKNRIHQYDELIAQDVGRIKNKTLTNSLETNVYGVSNVFHVEVLAEPVDISTGNPASQDDQDSICIKFTGRILDREGAPSPHCTIPHPNQTCDDLVVRNRNEILNAHTIFISSVNYTNNGPRPQLGDICKVELQPGQFSYNLQQCLFDSITVNSPPVPPVSQARIDSRRIMAQKQREVRQIGQQEQEILQIDKKIPQEIIQLAKGYDGPEISDEDKQQHIRGVFGTGINDAHPLMTIYMKAFIYKVFKDTEKSIQVNQTYRTTQQQKKMRERWENLPQDKKDDFIMPGQRSYHTIGMAFDFNIAGVPLTKKSTKQQWNNSKIPSIGKSLGLQWGGDFRNNYDPIHFDLGPVLKKMGIEDPISEMLKIAFESGRDPTEIEIPV